MKLRVLSAHHIAGLIAMPAASAAMQRAFRELSTGRVSAPERSHVDNAALGGKTLLMGAHVPDVGLAAKIVSYFPNNRKRGLAAIHGIVVVLDEASGVPVALLDGTWLTAFRTGAGTCASIELLARPDARCGALFGCGGQAAMQLLALDSARTLRSIRVFAPRADRAQRFIEALQPKTRARLELAQDATHAVRDADVVVAATSSSIPVFDGHELPEGCHVTAIGSISRAMQEVDETTVARSHLFVDSLPGALEEAGELIAAIERGVIEQRDLTEIGSVVAEPGLGRRDDVELTFYKSVGHAVQDVAIARLVLDRARELDIGEEIEL